MPRLQPARQQSPAPVPQYLLALARTLVLVPRQPLDLDAIALGWGAVDVSVDISGAIAIGVVVLGWTGPFM